MLSYGFRPFFFVGACYAALGIALWLPLFEGEIAVPSEFAPRDWHIHEMLFGYIAAVITSCLLPFRTGPGGCRCRACRCLGS